MGSPSTLQIKSFEEQQLPAEAPCPPPRGLADLQLRRGAVLSIYIGAGGLAARTPGGRAEAAPALLLAADPGLGLGGAGAGEGGKGGEDAEPEILLQELPRLAVRRLLQGRLYLTRRPVEGQQILPMYYFLAL